MNEFKYTGTETQRLSTRKSMEPFPGANHIGAKKWKRLSPGQKKAIIRERASARDFIKEFIKV